MDLEEFDLVDRGTHPEGESLPKSLSVSDALKWVDAEWHLASRRARWMDLIGDYAGQEPFIVDGHSLIQLVLDDPLLALAKPDDPSFQILHAIHLLEHTLQELIKRSAMFDVVFWDSNRHCALMTGSDQFNVTSRSLARRILFNHLRSITCVRVHAFADISDPKWVEYRRVQKPMFVLVNDGSVPSPSRDAYDDHRLLCHRHFLFNLLHSGLALVLLQGAEFRESKILSFVYESRLSARRSADVLPKPVRKALSTASAALDAIEQGYGAMQCVTLCRSPPQLAEVHPIVVLQKVVQGLSLEGETNDVLLSAYIAHVLILEQLSVQDRARRLEPIRDELRGQLITSFFPSVLRATEKAIVALNTTIDVDVHVFLTLLRFLAENPGLSLQEAFGSDIANSLITVFPGFALPISEFSALAQQFLPRPTPIPPPQNQELLPFKNEVFDVELAPLHGLVPTQDDGHNNDHGEEEEEESDDESVPDEWDESSEDECDDGDHTEEITTSRKSAGYFDDGILYHDTQHWHNHKKAILPKHQGGEAPASMNEWQRRKKLKREQQFMKRLHDQAATLTGIQGAILQQIKIPLVGSAPAPSLAKQKPVHSHPPSKGGSKNAPKQSKADIIREQNMAKKTKQKTDESAVWLKQRIIELDAESSEAVLNKMFSDMERNPRLKDAVVTAELSLYKIHRILLRWIGNPQRDTPSVRDKNSIAVMRLVRDIQATAYATTDIHKCLREILTALGFSDYIELLTVPPNQEDRPLNFRFTKLLKSKTKAPAYEFMLIQEHPVEWQLRLFGEFMDRSMDSQKDSRVTFKADAWQREVLDAIDQSMSLLAVAPTSAGKTFISFYAMEKVLRSTDEGIVVYVAPTKALVVQVAAEIYARFSKDLKGRSCWAIHTRDYRVNDPQSCQILVTVPEILAIMLLSPPLARVWAPRVQYIILDEIHSIGQQEGGSVWEQILLLSPSPIIGLSATVGSPDQFNEWLAMVQQAAGFKHKFVHHPHRYSHLRKFFYNIYEKPKNVSFESLVAHQTSERMRFLHPISLLAFGARSIPSDLALEAADTLTLYKALRAHSGLSASVLERLEPTNFFPPKKILQQRDVIMYDEALKECLAPMLESFDPQSLDSPLSQVISYLEDDKLSQVPPNQIYSQPDRKTFKRNLIYLVADLHAQGDLPAILFSFDRSDCEIMADTLESELRTREKKWRKESPEWQRKLAQYEAWLSRAKERERLAARAAATKKDPDEPRETTVEWQASFDPNEPLPAFSFANTRAYSMGELTEDIRGLAWSSVPDWAFRCLRRGIAVHHAGMNKSYRMLIESLFRRGFIRVMIATGTLALGINAPTKTSVFCGDSPYLTALMYRQCAGRAGRRGYDLLGKVVFYGLAMDRVRRLALSRLPSLGVNFPVTSTLILRLFNLLDGSLHAPVAVKAVQKLFRLPRITLGSEEGKHQLLHHLRFTIDYLRRTRLLDEQGRPFNLFGIAAQLYYTEPSNLALVALLRSGVIHRICCQPSMIQAKRNFVILMSHLFGRRRLPSSFLTNEHIVATIKNSSSVVILPPLPEDARRVLGEQNREILRVFTAYALTYGSKHGTELGSDTRLPLSNRDFSGTTTTREESVGSLHAHLQESAIPVVVRSPFVANSGHDDNFDSVPDLTCTARRGLTLHQYAIPSFADILTPTGESTGHYALNAYILDFFTHGQVQPLTNANAIRRGDIWFILQDFHLTLMTVRGVLEQLIMRKARAMIEEMDDDEVNEQDDELMELNLSDEEVDDVDDEMESGKGDSKGWFEERTRPRGVSEEDWRVLQVVEETLQEFSAKFKEMWA